MIPVILLALALQAAPANTVVFSSYSSVEGKNWHFPVTAGDLQRAPVWHASEDAHPPLAPGLALKAARAKLRTIVKRADDWELERVTLKPARPLEDQWIYMVDFLTPLPEVPPGGAVGSFLRSSVTVIVLMDGTAVTPVEEPTRR